MAPARGILDDKPTRARTHTHTEICNTYCFRLQQWLRERAPVFSYMYTVCLVNVY